MCGTARAREDIESAVGVLCREVGLDERDTIRLPVLFGITGQGLSNEPATALLPAVVNLLTTGQPLVFAPRQYAPIVNGVDISEILTDERLAAIGTSAQWVKELGYEHPGGEVDCATNAVRDLGILDPWWLGGPTGAR